MTQTHNLTEEERERIETLIKSFDNHGCGFGFDLQAQVELRLLIDKLDDANQAIKQLEAEVGR